MSDTAQLGDIFIKEISGSGKVAVRAIRVIMPIGTNFMVKFDIVAVNDRKVVEVWGIMFYKRGDRYNEEKALDGDLA
jgi:hypothetical protein